MMQPEQFVPDVFPPNALRLREALDVLHSGIERLSSQSPPNSEYAEAAILEIAAEHWLKESVRLFRGPDGWYTRFRVDRDLRQANDKRPHWYGVSRAARAFHNVIYQAVSGGLFSEQHSLSDSETKLQAKFNSMLDSARGPAPTPAQAVARLGSAFNRWMYWQRRDSEVAAAVEEKLLGEAYRLVSAVSISAGEDDPDLAAAMQTLSQALQKRWIHKVAASNNASRQK